MTRSTPTGARSSRLPQPRCGHPSCQRFVRRGETFCLQHRDAVEPAEYVAADDEPRRVAYSAGEYRELLVNEVRSTLADVTSEMLELGLVDELGALRLVLNRLLQEEEDISRLVSGATRIVTAAAQALRAQHALVDKGETEAMERMATLMQEVLRALDAEREEMRS